MPTTVKWGMRAPHRVLRVTSPHTRGEDVKALQLAINKRGRSRGGISVEVDGEYGPATDAAVDAIAYRLGLHASTVRRDGATVGVQRIIRAPQTRTDRQRERAEHRKTAGGPQAALAWATAQIGTREHPAGSNTGPKIRDWQRLAEMGAGPWCGAFDLAAALAGGVRLTPEVRYVPWIESHAKAGTGGLAKWVAPKDMQPGDLACFNFGVGIGRHTGMVESVNRAAGTVTCIEGNTSGAGSQDNGGMVLRKTRPLSHARGAGRPRWP